MSSTSIVLTSVGTRKLKIQSQRDQAATPDLESIDPALLASPALTATEDLEFTFPPVRFLLVWRTVL